MGRSTGRATFGAEAQRDWAGALPTPFPRPIGPNALRYLQEVVESGLTVDMVGRFERAFAAALGVKHCIAAPGCTPALAIWAAAAGYAPGDEVIVSPISDYGTIMGLVREQLIPVFADTEPGSPNLSADTVAPCITDRTRAVLVVHMTGLMPDMPALERLCAEHGLELVEDACQAVFSRSRGRLAGTIGHVGAFSFDSEKTMGSDVGGCLVTNDDNVAERARFIGHSRGAAVREGFGRVHLEPGYAYRMPHCTAAICLAQLEGIGEQVARRDRLIRLLTERLAELPGIVPLPIPDHLEVWSCWMAGFSLAPGAFDCDADTFAEELAGAGLPGAGTGRYYCLPEACEFLHRASAEETYPFSRPPASRRYVYPGSCPTAVEFLDRFVRWSTFCEKYTEADVDRAAAIVAAVAERHRA